MREKFTNEYYKELMNRADNRSRQFSAQEIIDVIDNSIFILSMTMQYGFHATDVISLDTYYSNNQSKFTYDISENVINIYDMFGLEKYYDGSFNVNEQDKIRCVITQDNENDSLVHVDLSQYNDSGALSCIVLKYFYRLRLQDDGTSKYLMLDPQMKVIMDRAVMTALYEYLDDTEKALGSKQILDNYAKLYEPRVPRDIGSYKPRMFPYGS